jgi:hypothetical protein
MTNNIILVPELAVRVVTGDTCYRYENGFSAIYAEVSAEDSPLAEQLAAAQKTGGVVTLRCAMLDVIGTIGKPLDDATGKTFVLSVQDMTYRKP